MLRLNASSRDAEADLRLVVDSSGEPEKAIIAALQRRVLIAYSSYVSALSGYGTCRSIGLNVEQSKAFKVAYETLRTRRALRVIRDDLLALADSLSSYCPLCGVEQASTLDHYAPKSSYPEFSIFSLNLIPCCPRCNILKGALGDQPVEEIPYVHPYFHSLEDFEILHATIERGARSFSIRYSLLQPEGLSDFVYGKVVNQVSRLRILERVLGPSDAELSSHAQNCARAFFYGGKDEVVRSCYQQWEFWRGRAGINHWRTALYRAMSINDDFCGGGFNLLLPSSDVSSGGLLAYGS